MGQAEFQAWIAFYRLHPFDDFHRFHRPAALMAHAAGRGDVGGYLDWLAPEPIPKGFTKVDLETMKTFGIKLPAKE